MIGGRHAHTQVAELMPTTLRLRPQTARRYRFLSWLFAREAVNEAVATRVHLNARPEAVWNCVMFYEEVPKHPPFLLRAVLPHPVRTEGGKTRVGGTVRCVYKRGFLVKRITTVEEPRSLKFDVVEQRLGIESCLLTLGGSYQIHSCGDAADVVLTTNYRAYLRPRYFWRRLEALLVSQLHDHILRGVCASLLPRNSAMRAATEEILTSQSASLGDLACTISQSRSHR